MDDELNRSNNNKDDTFGDGDGQEEAPLYIAKIKSSQGNKDENRQGELPNKDIATSSSFGLKILRKTANQPSFMVKKICSSVGSRSGTWV